jgi:Na+/proline symporter
LNNGTTYSLPKVVSGTGLTKGSWKWWQLVIWEVLTPKCVIWTFGSSWSQNLGRQSFHTKLKDSPLRRGFFIIFVVWFSYVIK